MTVPAPAVDLGIERTPAPPRTPPSDSDGQKPADPEGTQLGPTRRPSTADRHRVQVESRARQFVQAIVEIIDGNRPVTQLHRMATEAVYDDLVARLLTLRATSPRVPRVEALPTRVGSVHVEQPHPASAEISARLIQGPRSRALALRLDLLGERWTCTAMRWG